MNFVASVTGSLHGNRQLRFPNRSNCLVR